MTSSERYRPSGEGIRSMVLTRMWPTPEQPHDGTFVKDEVEALRRRGVHCQVVAECGAGGARCYIRLWRKMRRALKEGDFDVIHAHYGTTGWVGRLQNSAPLVVTFHGSDLMGGRLTSAGKESVMGHIEMALGWALARIVPNSIVVSPTMLAKVPPGGAEVIAAGVDLTLFRPAGRSEARRALGLKGDHPIVLFVANPELVNKQYQLATDAVRLARRSIPDLELLTVTGRPHAELADWMNAADALVLTSRVEGSPMVIKEALACNLPVVSVDVGDVAERLRDVSGCHLVERELEAIAKSLVVVITESKRCNGREAVAELSSDACARKVVDVYRSAIHGFRRAKGSGSRSNVAPASGYPRTRRQSS